MKRCLQTKETLQHHLNNTATIWMSREHSNVVLKSRDNKPNFRCRNTFNTLLYDVICILISHTFHDMSIKLMHKLCFLVKFNNLKGLERVPAKDQELNTHQYITIRHLTEAIDKSKQVLYSTQLTNRLTESNFKRNIHIKSLRKTCMEGQIQVFC